MPPLLTIGIPVFDDFSRLQLMIQAIRLLHADALPDCELVVVDNSPGSKDGVQLKAFLDQVAVSEEKLAWADSGVGRAGGSAGLCRGCACGTRSPCGTCQWVCFGMMGGYAWLGDGDFCTFGCGCQEPTPGTCGAGNVGSTTSTNCA